MQTGSKFNKSLRDALWTSFSEAAAILALKVAVVTFLGLLIKYQSPSGAGGQTGPSLLLARV